MTKVWGSELPTATHKLVLLAFADHANDEGFGWPSINHIAGRTQLSRRQTIRIVDDLKKTGLLEVVQAAHRHRSPLYAIRGDKLTPLSDLGVTSEQVRGDIEALRGDISALGVTSEQVRGDIPIRYVARAEPSLESSLRTVIENHQEAVVDFSFFDTWKEATGNRHHEDPRREDRYRRVKEAT